MNDLVKHPSTVSPLSLASHDGVPVRRPAGNKFVAKGHDAQLQDAQYSKSKVILTMISGASISGLLVKRDKFTITIRHQSGEYIGQDEIFYKHAIEGVLVIRQLIDSAK
jgi:sRNA-binding regulator protein Hfq